eukprot:PhF_6_TR12494/c0_g1_i1/m.19629
MTEGPHSLKQIMDICLLRSALNDTLTTLQRPSSEHHSTSVSLYIMSLPGMGKTTLANGLLGGNVFPKTAKCPVELSRPGPNDNLSHLPPNTLFHVTQYPLDDTSPPIIHSGTDMTYYTNIISLCNHSKRIRVLWLKEGDFPLLDAGLTIVEVPFVKACVETQRILSAGASAFVTVPIHCGAGAVTCDMGELIDTLREHKVRP